MDELIQHIEHHIEIQAQPLVFDLFVFDHRVKANVVKVYITVLDNRQEFPHQELGSDKQLIVPGMVTNLLLLIKQVWRVHIKYGKIINSQVH